MLKYEVKGSRAEYRRPKPTALLPDLELRLPLLLMQLSQDVYITHIMVIVLGVSR